MGYIPAIHVPQEQLLEKFLWKMGYCTEFRKSIRSIPHIQGSPEEFVDKIKRIFEEKYQACESSSNLDEERKKLRLLKLSDLPDFVIKGKINHDMKSFFESGINAAIENTVDARSAYLKTLPKEFHGWYTVAPLDKEFLDQPFPDKRRSYNYPICKCNPILLGWLSR